MIVPGSGIVKEQAAEGLDKIFIRPASVARAELSDVPRQLTPKAVAGRALRLDLEPQFRASGLRPHASGVTDHSRGGGDRRALCRHPG